MPWYVYTTIRLATCPGQTPELFPPCAYREVVPLCTHRYVSLFLDLCSVLWDTYIGVELLGNYDNSMFAVSTAAAPFYIATSTV